MNLDDREFSDTVAELAELRGLLDESYQLTRRPDNWLFGRLEDWKYGGNALRAKLNPRFFAERARLWRAGGRLVGFCIAEYDQPEIYLQVHPEYHAIEPTMLDWAERVWARGLPEVSVFAFDHDTQRRALLASRGYTHAVPSGILRSFDLARERAPAPLPPGFRVGSLADDTNVASHIAAVAETFGNTSLGQEWFDSKRRGPCYEPAWDMAVLAPGGEHAAFLLARLDRRNRVAEIDPIGTRPAFQRLGLAKALVSECFRRLAAAGIERAFIGSGPEPAVGNRLYEALAPAGRYYERRWLKAL